MVRIFFLSKAQTDDKIQISSEPTVTLIQK
jgi:hypothetical protein